MRHHVNKLLFNGSEKTFLYYSCSFSVHLRLFHACTKTNKPQFFWSIMIPPVNEGSAEESTGTNTKEKNLFIAWVLAVKCPEANIAVPIQGVSLEGLWKDKTAQNWTASRACVYSLLVSLSLTVVEASVSDLITKTPSCHHHSSHPSTSENRLSPPCHLGQIQVPCRLHRVHLQSWHRPGDVGV